MEYPLKEKIGRPELLVGRKEEFEEFDKWIAFIPEELSKSRVILARRKSGKTSFVQRIFNKLWVQGGEVIPFYFDITESKIWYPDFAILYFSSFATQYISFIKREAYLLKAILTLDEIRQYGRELSVPIMVRSVDLLLDFQKRGLYTSMWQTAATAPHRFADLQNQKILVILDEFQNIASYIYDPHFPDKPIESLAGSFHSLSESKIAPMLVTGSYVRWLIHIMDKYLEAGRLSRIFLNPYLTPEEGLEAVYKYAEVYRQPVTNETALLINQLCFSDPFFISCIFQSRMKNRDLTTSEGVSAVVDYEITNRESEMSMTWREYIELTLSSINNRNTKAILLYLSKHNERFWRPGELKEALDLELPEQEIQRQLLILAESDLIKRGVSDIQFGGLKDGTLNLVLRNRFEEEISGFVPDLKQEFKTQIARLKTEKRQLQGMLNNLTGQVAEMQLANSFRSRKRFKLSEYFEGVKDTTTLNIVDVKLRLPLQREDGKKVELDVVAESACGRVVAVEVKKAKVKSGLTAVEDFLEKSELLARDHPGKPILSVFLSVGGFTEEAREFCKEQGIGTADGIKLY